MPHRSSRERKKWSRDAKWIQRKNVIMLKRSLLSSVAVDFPIQSGDEKERGTEDERKVKQLKTFKTMSGAEEKVSLCAK